MSEVKQGRKITSSVLCGVHLQARASGHHLKSVFMCADKLCRNRQEVAAAAGHIWVLEAAEPNHHWVHHKQASCLPPCCIRPGQQAKNIPDLWGTFHFMTPDLLCWCVCISELVQGSGSTDSFSLTVSSVPANPHHPTRRVQTERSGQSLAAGGLRALSDLLRAGNWRSVGNIL